MLYVCVKAHKFVTESLCYEAVGRHFAGGPVQRNVGIPGRYYLKHNICIITNKPPIYVMGI